MYARVATATLRGLESELVMVETDLSSGLPSMTIVGLPDLSVREARERIRTAMANTGYRFPSKRITVNLSPADTKKEGTHFDLPIAVAVMAAFGHVDAHITEKYAFLGELSLDGRINRVHGALPLAIGLLEQGIKQLILPKGNQEEVAVLEGIKLYPVSYLQEVEAHLSGSNPIEPFAGRPRQAPAPKRPEAGDFADVAGQETVKRALQIAAAAAHNLLMIGPPGAGKTMMARRIPSILPSMTYEERLEVTKIYSIAGELKEGVGLMADRPFRAPHHTISSTALIGGGGRPKPGEVSLAHYGVLFLDELPEFSRRVLEVLRQPLEDEKVTISRISSSTTYPAKLMLVAAMNPCPCGYYGDSTHVCTCSEYQIQQYLSKLSGPLLDRIDLHIEILPVPFQHLMEEEFKEKKRTSQEMRREVEAARLCQLKRYKKETISYNSQLTPDLIKRYCPLGKDAKELLRLAFERYGLSARAHQKIVKLARTIADLEGQEEIRLSHVAEAIQYRTLDKRFRKDPMLQR